MRMCMLMTEYGNYIDLYAGRYRSEVIVADEVNLDQILPFTRHCLYSEDQGQLRVASCYLILV